MPQAGRKRTSRGARSAASLWRLVSAAGIALLGFAIGLVAGSVLEGPRLLIEWARGPSQGVELALADPRPVDTGPLSEVTELHEPDRPVVTRRIELPRPAREAEPEETGSRPGTAEARPAEAAPAATRPVTEELRREIQARPVPASAAPAAGPVAAPARPPAAAARATPVVQVASTRDPAEARRIVARLRSSGFDVYSVAVSPNGSTTHRVRVRTKGGESPAQLADRLKAQGFETWITSD
jgi:cell division septation protein DedD